MTTYQPDGECKMDHIKIVTSRLKISPVDAADIHLLALIIRDPCVYEPYYLEPMPNCPDTSIGEAWQLTTGEIASLRRLNLTVRERQNDRIVGCIQFNQDNISYFVEPMLWGRGYATEAVLACCKVVPHILGITRLRAKMLRNNIASRLIVERAGFQFEGLHTEPFGSNAEMAILHYSLNCDQTCARSAHQLP